MLLSGLLLGLANGGACLATCAAVLVPLFLGEGRRVGENGSLLARFMAGRLVGYLLFAVLAWAANWLILRDPALRAPVFAGAYFVLAGMMLAYGAGRLHLSCVVPPSAVRAQIGKAPAFSLPALRPLIPALFGLLTGLNLCPPFLLAFTNAALNGTLLGSLGFFLAFFVGTSVYLVPVPFVGAFRKNAALQTIGKFSAMMMSLYYVLSGILLIFEGRVL